MSPPCSKASMRVLISVLLASGVANAAALPHQVLDARAPAAIQNAELAAEAIQAAASAAAENPTNFFEDISDELNNRTAWEVFRDFFTRLFGPREDDDDTPTTVTVTVAPAAETTTTAAVEVSASVEASISLDIIVPPGPTSLPSEIVSVISEILSETPYTTPTPTSEAIFSILPIGDLTTSINATDLTPIFVTEPATDVPEPTASVIEVLPPFPVENGTTTDILLPTAVPITDEFPAITPTLIEATLIEVPATTITNTSEPVETLVGPIGTELPVVNVTVPIGTGVPAVNVSVPTGTGNPFLPPIINITIPVETVVAPSETDLPVTANTTLPEGTGIATLVPAPANSTAPAGTGLTFFVPIANATALPLPANSTADSTTLVVVTETVIPVPVTVTGVDATASAGTGLPPVVVASPLWPNSTYDEPTGIALPIGTAIPVGTGTAVTVPLVTGVPLSTGVEPSVGTALPIAASDSPIFPNTTTATSTSTLVIPIPILVTGVPEPATVNVTIPASPVSETVDPLASLTELPLTVTGTPGNVLAINVTIPVAPFANSTDGVVEATSVLTVETTATAVTTVGTELPIETLAAGLSGAPFANSTAPTTVEASASVEASAIVILPAPVETPAGQLNVTVSLNGDYNG